MTSSETMRPSLEDRRWDLEYRASVARRYHVRRAAFLENLARLEPIVPLLLSATAFAAVTNYMSFWVKVLTLTTAVVSALTLAFRIPDRAKLHDQLYRRWTEILDRLLSLNPDDATGVRALESEWMKISADTPHQLRALSILCQNEENEFRRSGDIYRIGWFQRLLVNWVTLPLVSFEAEKRDA